MHTYLEHICRVRTETYEPVSKRGMELDDEVVLLLGDVPPLHPVSEVVDPPEPAALAAPQQPCM